MTKGVQNRRGNTDQHSNFNGEPGEITVNTDRWTVVVQDGTTNGGYEHVNINSTQRITNKDIVATNLTVSGVSTFSDISRFNVTGIASFGQNSTVIIGAAGSTGTGNQNLQVTGNVYLSANTGIGTTNALERLHVVPSSTSVAGLFSGSTSSDMVRITQLGTGNALLVEDSANPDSTPFVIHSSGPVGCGTTSPSAQLHVQVTTGGPAPTAGLFSGTSNSINEPIVRITQLSSGPALTVSTGVGLTNPGLQVTGIGSVGVGTIGIGVSGILAIGAGGAVPNTAPVKLISGSLLSAAEQGAIEYVTPNIFFTPTNNERGVIFTPQYFSLNADRTGPTAANQSFSIFGAQCNLSPSTRYEYEINFSTTKTSANAAAIAYGIGTTSGSVTHHRYTAITGTATTTGAVTAGNATIMSGNILNPPTNPALAAHLNTISAASAAAASAHNIHIYGIIETGTAGVVGLSPRFAYTLAPTASTIIAEGYMKITPVGTTASNTSIGTWVQV